MRGIAHHWYDTVKNVVFCNMNYNEIIKRLQSQSNPEIVAGMARFGIKPTNACGISIPNLRSLAAEIKKKAIGPNNHALASQLWSSGIHEARILATLIDDPQAVTEDQLELWVKDIDSWDICDQCCNNLFARTEFAYKKAIEWSARPEEFVKRAGFALMATLAFRDKQAPDSQFEQFFPLIKKEATDDRNFVKKAVNWALRQIGKRNRTLNQSAIALAREIQQIDSKPARWIASNALRELTSLKVQERINKLGCRVLRTGVGCRV